MFLLIGNRFATGVVDVIVTGRFDYPLAADRQSNRAVAARIEGTAGNRQSNNPASADFDPPTPHGVI